MSDCHGITVLEESESVRGWHFRCDLVGCGQVHARLDWSDYDHWCPGGDVSPSQVVVSILMLMLDEGITVPATFDVARIHRLLDDPDAVHKAIRRREA